MPTRPICKLSDADFLPKPAKYLPSSASPPRELAKATNDLRSSGPKIVLINTCLTCLYCLALDENYCGPPDTLERHLWPFARPSMHIFRCCDALNQVNWPHINAARNADTCASTRRSPAMYSRLMHISLESPPSPSPQATRSNRDMHYTGSSLAHVWLTLDWGVLHLCWKLKVCLQLVDEVTIRAPMCCLFVLRQCLPTFHE